MSEEERGGGATPPPGDVLLVVGKGDEDSLRVVRRRGESVELGALRAAEEGKPLHGELVRLNRRSEHPLLFDVDVLADARPVPAPPRSGPPQVATRAYRAGWETIFGDADPDPDGQLN